VSQLKVGGTRAAGLLRRATALLSLGLVLLFAQPVGQAAPDESLPFTTSYSVTGNYVVGGVDLLPAAATNGFVTGTIPMSGVPANADILAAFLYWETISAGPALGVGAIGGKFREQDITVEKAYSTSSLLNPQFSPCWSSGGGGDYTLTMYRADVLRFLPAQPDTDDNATGKRLVNNADLLKYGIPLHTVTLPEAGTGNQVPQSAGASLFVVYRDSHPAAPLTTVVLYDGLFVQTQGQAMTHTIRGFLDAADINPVAKMTHLVGSGAPNSNDQVYFNNQPVTGGLDSFHHTSGGASDRAWSNPTFENLSLAGLLTDPIYGDSVTTKVDHGGQNTPNDCLSWAAIIFSTTVQDTDQDGVPDGLENAVSGLKEPNDEDLPNVHAMGAIYSVKDLFVEVAFMETGGYTKPLGQGVVSPHNHRPTPAALKMVGDAFWCGGVAGCDASALSSPNLNGVHVHFDVGNAYPTYTEDDAYAERYIIRDTTLDLARGGESILELSCVDIDPMATCRFPDYPGTVGWKIGLQLYRDAPVHANGAELLTTGPPPPIPDTAAMDACESALGLVPTQQESGDCRRRFDHNRKDIFHYGLYAHAVGISKSEFPCRIPGIPPVPTEAQPDGTCAPGQEENPDFTTPKSMSGGGDLPGGDFMVTLGFWDNFVGTDFFQASTTMHELGHNLDRWHGADPAQFSEVGSSPNVLAVVSFEPNCKPNYLSVMSYLFQLHGLRDNDGVPHLDYSSVAGSPIGETSLVDGYVPPGPYSTSWFAPLVEGSLGFTLGTPAAKKYCNGSKLPVPLPPVWVDFARIDGASVGAAIDWNANPAVSVTSPQNVNFDGDGDGDLDGSIGNLNGSVDWVKLRLNQVGARRNMAAFSAGLSWGGLSWGGLSWGGDELDFETAAAAGFAPPNELKACVFGGGGVPAEACPAGLSGPLHRVRLEWKAPNGGVVSSPSTQYSVFRYVVAADKVTPLSKVTQLAGVVESSVVDGVVVYSLVDGDELPTGNPPGIMFNYFVKVTFEDGTVSGPSNFANITAVNDPPTAVAVPPALLPDLMADSYSTSQGATLVVPAVNGVLGNDTAGADSKPTSLKAVAFSGLSVNSGTVTLSGDGSFTYIPSAAFVGTDTFTYRANNGRFTYTRADGGIEDVAMSLDSGPVTVTIKVFSLTGSYATSTTCQQVISSTGLTQEAGNYSVKLGKISQVNPGVIFYYSGWTPQNSTAYIDQAIRNPIADLFKATMKVQSVTLYKAADCSAAPGTAMFPVSVATDGSYSPDVNGIMLTGLQVGLGYVVGVKYSVNSLVGATAPTAPGNTILFEFQTRDNIFSVVTKDDNGFSLKKK